MAKRKSDSQSEFIYSAISHMRKTQHEIRDNQNVVLKLMKEVPSNFLDYTFDNLARDCREHITKQKVKIFELSKVTSKSKIHGVNSHKLLEASSGALDFSTDENISALLSGRLPSAYNNDIPTGELPRLGGGPYWGTSKPVFVNFTFAVISNFLTGQKINHATIGQTSIFHSFPMPEGFVPSEENDIMWLSSQEKLGPKKETQYFLTVPHCGYSWGGDRMNFAKLYKPQDCTSFLEMIYSLPPSTASSADLYLAAQSGVGVDPDTIVADWSRSSSGSLVKLFNVNKNPSHGDIMVARTFNALKPSGTIGAGGHAGIVLYQESITDFITLAYNRNMPFMDGFGIEKRTCLNNSEKQTFFLSRKPGDIPLLEGPAFDPRDISSYVTAIDKQVNPESFLTGEDNWWNEVD